jgi:hypothetical protein
MILQKTRFYSTDWGSIIVVRPNERPVALADGRPMYLAVEDLLMKSGPLYAVGDIVWSRSGIGRVDVVSYNIPQSSISYRIRNTYVLERDILKICQ